MDKHVGVLRSVLGRLVAADMTKLTLAIIPIRANSGVDAVCMRYQETFLHKHTCQTIYQGPKQLQDIMTSHR